MALRIIRLANSLPDFFSNKRNPQTPSTPSKTLIFSPPERAEDETARLYAEFVESFQGSDAPGSKAFVRGGLINPNEKLKADSEGGKFKDGVSVPKKGTR